MLLRFRQIFANIPKFLRSLDQRALAALLFFWRHRFVHQTIRRVTGEL